MAFGREPQNFVIISPQQSVGIFGKFNSEAYAPMRSTLEHLPERKQRELSRVVEIIHEEFEDALAGTAAEFKKKGRILKIILFGSHARGDWVDEPHTMKGYRSDFELLIIVNDRKLTDFSAYWYKVSDRLLRDGRIGTQVCLLVHSRRETNTFLKHGHYLFSEIRNSGIVLYELDPEPLASAAVLSADDAYCIAQENFNHRFNHATVFMKGASFYLCQHEIRHAAFETHQAIEHAYSALLLTLTNYDPHSHRLAFLRILAEEQDRRLAAAWPRDQQRFNVWFNTINEAYVKARYSRHYEVSEEALRWMGDRITILHELVETACRQHLARLKHAATSCARRGTE